MCGGDYLRLGAPTDVGEEQIARRLRGGHSLDPVIGGLVTKGVLRGVGVALGRVVTGVAPLRAVMTGAAQREEGAHKEKKRLSS